MDSDVNTATIQAKFSAWKDYRRGMVAAQTVEKIAGHSWVDYPPVCGETVHGRLSMVPAGHVAPGLKAQADTALLGVRGVLDVFIGEDRFVLNPLDMLIMPAGTRYAFSNGEIENALVFLTIGTGRPEQLAPEAPVGGDIQFYSWKDYRTDFKWSLPLSDTWGFRRGSGPYFGADNLRGHTVRQPPGQATPWHYAPRDLLFMPVSGEVEFRCGGQAHPLGPLDILVIPATMPYQYTNNGLEEVVFLSIGGALPEGGKGRYFSEDPGWPVRADAGTLATSVDPYGNAKIN